MGGPRYPNQQLSSVTLELAFKGRFAVYATLAQLQDRHAARFDTVLVPNAQEGISPLLQPFWLRSSKEADSLLVALNQIAYRSERYPGFSAFVAEGLPLLLDALALSGTVADRAQYRYQNAIGLGRRDDGTLAVDAVLRSDRVESMFLGSCTHIQVDTREKFEGGTELATQITVEPGDVLKLDLMGVAHLASRDVATAVADAHDVARTRFEALICDEFRAELRGTEERT